MSFCPTRVTSSLPSLPTGQITRWWLASFAAVAAPMMNSRVAAPIQSREKG